MSRIFAALLTVASVAGCGGEARPPAGDGAVPVKLQLNWFPEAEHGGYYAAAVLGLYEEAGLDVEIVPGGPGVQVCQLVATGRVDFGVANADRVLLLREQGADVVSLYAPITHTPRCVLVPADAGVGSFADLSGFELAMGNQPFAEFLKAKVLPADVSVVPFNGGVNHLLLGGKRGQQGYTFSEPFVAAREGLETTTLMLSDVGFDPYCSCLVGRAVGTVEAGDVPSRMRQAAATGWSRYLEDDAVAAKTHAAIVAANPEMSPTVLEEGRQALRGLVEPETPDEERARWDDLAELMREIGVLGRSGGPGHEALGSVPASGGSGREG
ncbi:MAG: ABC transporter substrate-binding protein [Planctomycetota bacterium]